MIHSEEPVGVAIFCSVLSGSFFTCFTGSGCLVCSFSLVVLGTSLVVTSSSSSSSKIMIHSEEPVGVAIFCSVLSGSLFTCFTGSGCLACSFSLVVLGTSLVVTSSSSSSSKIMIHSEEPVGVTIFCSVLSGSFFTCFTGSGCLACSFSLVVLGTSLVVTSSSSSSSKIMIHSEEPVGSNFLLDSSLTFSDVH